MTHAIDNMKVIIAGRCWCCDTPFTKLDDGWQWSQTCNRAFRVEGDRIRERVPFSLEWRGKRTTMTSPVHAELDDGSIVVLVADEQGSITLPLDVAALHIWWP